MDIMIMILYICLYSGRQSGLTDYDHKTNKSNISDSIKDVFCDDKCLTVVTPLIQMKSHCQLE